MPEIQLRRDLLHRLVCGRFAQPMIALFTVLVLIRLIALLAGASHDRSLSVGVTAAVLAVLVVLLLVGATAHAEADAQEIRWRYYLAHHVAWADVTAVDLGVRPMGNGTLHYVEVGTAHGRHRISPAYGAGAGRVRFGRDLLAAAEARGIPVSDGWR